MKLKIKKTIRDLGLRRIMIGGLLIIASFGCFCNSYSYASQSSVAVTNHIQTGDINLDLMNLENFNEKEQDFTNNQIITPGDTISDIYQIKNLANDSWIRVKTEYIQPQESKKAEDQEAKETNSTQGNTLSEGADEGEEILFSDANLKGITDQWVPAKDGYYYYKEIVTKGQSIEFMQAITFPSEWTEDVSKKQASLTVTAEAVQAKNFTPQFDTDKPWNDTKAEVCIHESEGEIAETIAKDGGLSVELEGATRKLIAVPDDFFKHFGELMPGDKNEGSILVSNTADKPVEFFFHTDLPGQLDDGQRDLLKQLKLTIKYQDQDIYNGDLESTSLDEISLGVIEPDQSEKMKFTVEMPKELGNEYAVRTTEVQWIFNCDIPDNEILHDEIQDEEILYDEVQGDEIESIEAPQTGLSDQFWGYFVAGIVFLMASVIVLRKKKGGHLEKEGTKKV